MAEFFKMPQATPTMEVGTISKWRKAEGEALKPQDVVAEVETDKAVMEIEVFDSAVLLKILVEAGVEVPAGRPIAILGKPGEDIGALLAAAGAPAAAPSAPTTAAPPTAPAAPAPAPAAPAAPAAAVVVASSAGLRPYAWAGEAVHEAIMEPPIWEFGDEAEAAPGQPSGRAAPAARRAAAAAGLDIGAINGTGPRGRVLRGDVEAALARPAAAPAPAAPAAPTSEVVKNSNMRKTIARRLTAAWQEAPAFYLTAVFDCGALVAFREQLKAAGASVSANDILIKACARALVEVPEVNASWGEDAILRHKQVHIGVAVAIPDGLITPVVRDADKIGLGAISAAMKDLAARAKERKLKPEEYTGSTFSISNLGMMGIEQFTAILNPPEAVILAVGGMQREPVVGADGQLTVGWRMRVTLTCDHRVVDGALGAQFLKAVRRYVEQPALLAT
ncbi:MAG: 2-oxo acid dehydrogenase subunit E2 [Deltaproteobacteria bacterium]|nr:2-oxo acid dehydrogenase subunit E2 [Deltaproteobacteria bacterium]